MKLTIRLKTIFPDRETWMASQAAMAKELFPDEEDKQEIVSKC